MSNKKEVTIFADLTFFFFFKKKSSDNTTDKVPPGGRGHRNCHECRPNIPLQVPWNIVGNGETVLLWNFNGPLLGFSAHY